MVTLQTGERGFWDASHTSDPEVIETGTVLAEFDYQRRGTPRRVIAGEQKA